ncbi:hypothetical protein FDP41_000717 [Naegleria fowleri]|uniref:Uncharacterized protein n=1 Tax=Naegleria fowleri TaxID=5763 RepID=A0A6A5CHV3_NAEFO|nr:uncharacterized protein FDP41_000717 [Naegleria fowleri]KAF0984818.1 hypothetical protein FDP41_000717 [Naegleria fowleri]
MNSKSITDDHQDQHEDKTTNQYDCLKKRKRGSSEESEPFEEESIASSPFLDWNLEEPSSSLSDESMFIPSSDHHPANYYQQQHSYNNNNSTLFQLPLFESEQDMIQASLFQSYNHDDEEEIRSWNNHNKRNKLSPHSHLVDFIRDHIMQYLLFHHLHQPKSSQHSSLLSSPEIKTTPPESSDHHPTINVSSLIPVGLLFDYIAQQAQRLYFNMYEHIRELAQIPTLRSGNDGTKYDEWCNNSLKAMTSQNTNECILPTHIQQTKQELSLACNEFEKLVIEQFHFLMDQVQLIKGGLVNSSNSHHAVIPMMKKYESILPINFGSIKLVSGVASSGIVGDESSTSIVDDSSLIKSENSPIGIMSSSSTTIGGYCDMIANAPHNNFDISSLLNSWFKFSSPTLSSFPKQH